jgi:hypothetical protein
MNGLKSIHTDILIIMIDDVNQRVRAGELSANEYNLQIAPLNSELYERAVTLVNRSVCLGELYRKQAEMDSRQAANNVRQVYESFVEYKSNTDRVIREYDDFLKDKQLDEAFQDWQDERTRQVKADGQPSKG